MQIPLIKGIATPGFMIFVLAAFLISAEASPAFSRKFASNIFANSRAFWSEASRTFQVLRGSRSSPAPREQQPGYAHAESRVAGPRLNLTELSRKHCFYHRASEPELHPLAVSIRAAAPAGINEPPPHCASQSSRRAVGHRCSAATP